MTPYLYSGYSDIIKTDTNGNLKTQRRLVDCLRPPDAIIKSSDNKILTLGTYYLDGNWDIYFWKMNTNLEDDTLYTQPLTYDSLCPYQILSDTVDLNCGVFVNINEIPTKEEYESTIKIWPNPATDWITLTLPDNISREIMKLAIYNIFGQEVFKKEINPSNRIISLNVSSLSSGLYVAVCKDQQNRMLKGKFVMVR
jgi:hypothetical protein